MSFDGAHISSPAGVVASYSTGQWNEICIERYNGAIYYWLNGVGLGSFADSNFYYDRIWFDFLENQQTYKYLDEFRFVNKALYSGNYTPSSVPFDTNLTLVLPDTASPVADEYWSFDKTITPYCSFDLTNYKNDSVFGSSAVTLKSDGLHFVPGSTSFLHDVSFDLSKFDSSYTFSLVASDGTIYSVPFSLSDSPQTIEYFTFPFGSVRRVFVRNGATSTYPSGYGSLRYDVVVNSGKTLDAVYVEVVPGVKPNTGHKYVTAIVPVTNYEKPTLAVRTDIPITGKQIGGARPSLPTKGLVWAMVESGVIRSLQIYNGTAWEACDGRIFTGTRWIPYSGYNIITLKDFYDVVDASGGNYEYIYSESGFWNWWQKSWNAFTNKLFAALSSAGFDVDSGTGIGGSLWSRIKNAFNKSLGILLESLFGLITDVLTALLSLVTDMLSFFFGFLTDATVTSIRAFFSAFSDDTLFDFFQQPSTVGPDGTEIGGGYGLPSEVGTAFGFISGVIMVLPPDLRSILFFGLAVMVLLGVFKLVKT